MVWSETYCMCGSSPIGSCQPSDTRCSGSWLHTVSWIKSGNQKVPETCVEKMALRQSFAVVKKTLSCLPTLRRRSVWENCIIHLPTTPPCSTRVDVLETGNVPILFSHPQMKHFGNDC